MSQLYDIPLRTIIIHRNCYHLMLWGRLRSTLLLTVAKRVLAPSQGRRALTGRSALLFGKLEGTVGGGRYL